MKGLPPDSKIFLFCHKDVVENARRADPSWNLGSPERIENPSNASPATRGPAINEQCGI
jgi:hypothetical protein